MATRNTPKCTPSVLRILSELKNNVPSSEVRRVRDIMVNKDSTREQLSSILNTLIAENNIEGLAYCISRGAIPDGGPKDATTPLYSAIQVRNEKAVEILLENNASLVKENNGEPGTCALQLVMKEGYSLGPIYKLVIDRVREMEERITPPIRAGRLTFDDNASDAGNESDRDANGETENTGGHKRKRGKVSK